MTDHEHAARLRQRERVRSHGAVAVMIVCRCPEIQAADPLRHFTGCPLREPLPEGHPATGSCVRPDPLGAEIAAEADRIEARFSAFTPSALAAEASSMVRTADRCAAQAGDAPTRRRHRVSCAAWALVALRAEARETAALLRCRHCNRREGSSHSTICAVVQFFPHVSMVRLSWCGDHDPENDGESAAKGGGHG